MKNPILPISVFLFSIICLGINSLYGQKTLDMPEGTTLSYNGVFVPLNDPGINSTSSDNGIYRSTYTIASVSDENRELTHFELFQGEENLFSLKKVPGSDVMISNSGLTAVFNMKFIYKHEVYLTVYNTKGIVIYSKNYKYASLFGFSPSGNKLVVGTDKHFEITDLVEGNIWQTQACSKYAFSSNEEMLITAKEGKLWVYKNFKLIHEISTGLFYPRALAIDTENDMMAIVGKSNIKVYHANNGKLIYEKMTPQHISFRDVKIHMAKVLAGGHSKQDGISKGILLQYDGNGTLEFSKALAEKPFRTFEKTIIPNKSTALYDPIPWPFEPFDEVHKVWNHYEQHMGNGSGDWSYLHQGLDIEVPIDEPTYAVEEGWVKLVLTIGGESYWRIAISPIQSSGYSDGWLYAHIVNSSIQVDVGDYVEVHDYLGDIIYWSDDWGHIHFVNIHDQGDIWYYDDDEWGINFNPLLALDPITDETAPVIEEFSSSSKFGFCENESSVYLSPDELTGEVDIIAKISDYHGSSEWEQPAYLTYYWFKKYPEGELVFPKTLGQILNHSYEMYNGGYYEAYAPLMYKKDFNHPSPPWMNHERDYFQILTNNNGDSIADPSETELAFNTANYYDGSYQLFIEVWDEYGNMAIDSQVVEFVNNNISGSTEISGSEQLRTYPNPANDEVFIRKGEFNIHTIFLYNANMVYLKTYNSTNTIFTDPIITVQLSGLNPGIYFMILKTEKGNILRKIIKK